MASRLEEREPGSVRRVAVPRIDLSSVWRPALLFLASRAVVLLAFVVACAARHGLGLRQVTVAWDGGFYNDIARLGYPSTLPAHGTTLLAFFPGFPLLTRLVRLVLHMTVFESATIVVYGCGLIATCCLWYLTRELADADAADRATALFVFGPGTFALSMTYSEATLVLCAVAACWAFIRKRWVLGGVLAAIGTATRPDGLALALAAACGAYVAFKRRRELRPLIAVALAPVGFVAVQLYLWIHTGDAFVYFRAERQGWHQGFSFGTGRVDDLRSALHTIFFGGRPDWNHVVPLAGLVFFVAAFVILLRWRPPVELIAFTVGIGFFALTSTHVGFRPRAVMVAFPLSMALGVRLRRSPSFALALGASAAFLVILVIVTVSTHYITP